MATSVENIEVSARSNPSQRIIAVAIVLACLFWASSVVIAILLAALIAYFLDPLVSDLERVHVPRGIGALLVLLLAAAVLSAAGYLVVDRAQGFADNWPRYSLVLRHAVAAVDNKLTSVERQVSQIAPDRERGSVAVSVEDSQSVRGLLLRAFGSLGSLYSVLLVWTFLPFLVFFMLAGKQKIWTTTLELFPAEARGNAKQALDQVSATLRGYVAGAMVVALILIAATWAFFWAIHLDYPFLTAVVSGLLNMVPYIGAVLAWGPPVLIGMVKWNRIGPFLGVAGTLTGLHIFGANVLMPALIGRRVHLNALAVTIALLFWGWFWGGFGLVLAIPITAVIKVICDHVPSWQPVGRWLGA